MGKALTDRAMVEEMIRFLGLQRTLALVGWCTVAALAGVEPTPEALLARGPGSRATRYDRLMYLRRFAEHLRAEGYDLAGVAEPVGLAVRAVAP